MSANPRAGTWIYLRVIVWGIVISRSPIATPTSLYTRQDCFTQWLNRDTMLQDNPKVYKALREIVANYERVKPGGGGTGCGGR